MVGRSAVQVLQAEGQVADGGHGAGAVAGPGLVVIFVPDGVTGPVFEVLDSPVSAGAGGDVGGGEGGATGEDEGDFFAEGLSGQVGLGSSADNALAESFFANLKREILACALTPDPARLHTAGIGASTGTFCGRI